MKPFSKAVLIFEIPLNALDKGFHNFTFFTSHEPSVPSKLVFASWK